MTDKEQKLKLASNAIEQWLEYQRYSSRIPSLSYAVTHKGKVLTSGAHGYADLKQEKEATTDTCYQIASIAKMFTAVSVLQLYEEERLRLDDKACKHLDWLNEENGDFTIRQLLSHRAGVKRDPREDFWNQDEVPTLEGLKEKFKEGGIVYEPLEKFKYSNLGFALLGLIIESVSGVSYRDYVQDNIIDQLGLKNTYMGLNEEAKEKLAVGYGREMKEGEPREAFSHVESGILMPAVGLITNALDLSKFLNALFLDNKLLEERTRRYMEEKNIMEEDENAYYGFGVKISKENGREIMGHGGGFTGFVTACGIDTDNEISVVMLTNGLNEPATSLTQGTFSIINYFLQKVDLEDEEDLELYEGIYTNRWGESAVVSAYNKLLAYAVASYNPLKKPAVLEKEDNHKFKIVDGSAFDNIGEEVKFEVEEGEVKKMNYAETPCEPFEIPDYKGGY